MTDRRGKILGPISLTTSLGLEIGPLHSPLVRRDEGRILYVDYASADILRANFRHPGDPAEIVDVDIIWGGSSLRDCVGEAVDYVVASHVIEHVPDLIGWLLELHAALKPGGMVGLAIPDRRRTFDIRRPVSLPGEMMEAWLLRRHQPSLRQVFDSAALSKDVAGPEDWRAGESTSGLPAETLGRLEAARDMVVALAGDPTYIDAHCWVFTPESFLDTAEALHRMGYFPFAIEAFHPTAPGDIEFIVRLRALSDPTDPAIGASIAAARAGVAAAAVAEPNETEGRVARLERENAALVEDLNRMRRSRSWRVTAPLRAARRLLGR